jgi:hypothetical protein
MTVGRSDCSRDSPRAMLSPDHGRHGITPYEARRLTKAVTEGHKKEG